MKYISVIGKTDATINLNKIGVPIRGKSHAVLPIMNPDQEAELMGIVRAGYLAIVPEEPIANEETQPDSTCNQESKDQPEKKKGGRPKGAKNKPKGVSQNPQAEEEAKRVAIAEAKTQQMGSRVIVGTSDGPKNGRMTRSAVNDITETEQTRASIEAMEKLNKEEKEDINLGDTFIDDSNLDASEQMGRKAVVVTEGGVNQKNMVNSILPESKKIREADPFIDKADKAEIKAKQMEDDDNLDASFIEI